MFVIPKAEVVAHFGEIREAIAEYIKACRSLRSAHAKGRLPAEWTEGRHGMEIRFENSVTKQVVEVPMTEMDWATHRAAEIALGGGSRLRRIDPYFFAIYVKSTPGLRAVARLIQHNYHDASRILDVVIDEGSRKRR